MDRPPLPESPASTVVTSAPPSEKPSLEDGRASEEAGDVQLQPTAKKPSLRGKGVRFWLVVLALCSSGFLSALDLTAVSTALPSIAADFNSNNYSWVASAYALTSTALIPWTGGLAAIFGRRPMMLIGLFIFALGSALVGAAQSMAMVIGGRSVQGVGGGVILTMSSIVLTDLVPLAERGIFFGILGAVWAGASAVGPPIGGALASAGAWRWLFYLNLPLAGVAIVLVFFCLDMKEPETTWSEKLAQMDYVNVVFVASATAAILGLTWGGTDYPWSSFRVLVPLVLGFLGMAAFVYVESTPFVKHPTVPFDVLRHPTSLIGYVISFMHGIAIMAIIYFFPIYMQACYGASAVQSGIDSFTLSFTIAPFAILGGISVVVTGHYKTQNLVGFGLAAVGFGLMTLLKYNSSTAAWAGYTVLVGLALGILFPATEFPVVAPLTPAQQPQGPKRRVTESLTRVTFTNFVRSFGQVFGISVGTTALGNQLEKNLPVEFARSIGKASNAIAAIPYIDKLEEPLRSQVRAAFADSLKVVWQTCIGVVGFCCVLSLFMKSLPLATTTDEENWGLKDREKAAAHEREAAIAAPIVATV
ncbi:hypothetical protein BMF94_3772 [Rhodotorula taiwanensis]|uniref:Major facilitator superfamily (MFS) profile domain-containing protein n=1 Tax=Rhodotorula taiwanensis TaxID=741276 RepID=A0A2S5B9I8_9BASI|nr:hypothetical protein BMF94_3772 [Rhodotorula taiwanensis]